MTMRMSPLPVLWAVVTLLATSDASKKSVGTLFEEGSRKVTGASGVFLYPGDVIDDGVVYQFEAMFLQRIPVRFQIWRPTDQSENMYYLVGEKRYIPSSVPLTTSVTLQPLEYIFTQYGDRFAIFNEGSRGALGYRFTSDPDEMMFSYGVLDPSAMRLGMEVQFNNIQTPETYSASANYDTDIYEYQVGVRDARRMAGTTTPMVTVPDVPPDLGTSRYLGNSLVDRERSLRTGARGAFLIQDVTLQTGRVTTFFANMVATGYPVRFQIWRPGINSDNIFTLVGEYRFVPVTTGKKRLTLAPDEYIIVKDGDKVGFTNEMAAGPIGYSFVTSQSGSFSASLSDANYPDVGQDVTFDLVGVPYNFALGVLYDIAPFSTTTGPTTDTSAPMSTIPELPSSQGTLIYGGNSLTSGGSLVGGARGAFLIQEVTLQTGKVTWFFANMAATEHPVRFQIWRPKAGSDNVFTLIGEHRFVPDRIGRTMVKLDEEDVIRTMRGDKLGFLNERDTGPISYSFNPSQPGSLPATLEGDTFPEVGQDVTFSTVGLPYIFAVGLMYDVGGELRETTLGIPTGRSSPTPLVPIASGERLLADGIKSPDKVLSVGARRTLLLKSQTFKEAGYVTSFWGYFVSGGEGQFQIWRPLARENVFRLVGKKDFAISLDPLGTSRFVEVPVDEHIAVEAGDSLAFVNADDTSVIGYQFQPGSLYYAQPSDGAAIGTTLQFEVVALPYKFGVAAAYIPATNLPTSSVGTTTGRVSSVSTPAVLMTSSVSRQTEPFVGISEPVTSENVGKTDKNDPERPLSGSEGDPMAASSMQTDEENGVIRLMREPYFILALFIWLIVLTVLFICVVCFLCCRKRVRSSSRTFYDNRGLSSRPASSYINWSSAMKDDESIDYFNSAIPSSAGRNLAGNYQPKTNNLQQARDVSSYSDDGDKTHL